MTDSDARAVLAEGVTLADSDGAVVCKRLSLSALRGTVYALMGHGRGPEVFLRALRGRVPIGDGRLTLFGVDPRRRWKLRSRRAFFAAGSTLPSPSTSERLPDLLLLERGESWPMAELAHLRRAAALGGTTVFMTTRDPSTAEGAADRIGMLARGRLVTDEPAPMILQRFRRIRYGNRLTETRAAFGTELDEFDAVQVRVRGWGVEAVVANFQDDAFDRLRFLDGVENASAEALTVAEVFEALREASD